MRTQSRRVAEKNTAHMLQFPGFVCLHTYLLKVLLRILQLVFGSRLRLFDQLARLFPLFLSDHPAHFRPLNFFLHKYVYFYSIQFFVEMISWMIQKHRSQFGFCVQQIWWISSKLNIKKSSNPKHTSNSPKTGERNRFEKREGEWERESQREGGERGWKPKTNCVLYHHLQ